MGITRYVCRGTLEGSVNVVSSALLGAVLSGHGKVIAGSWLPRLALQKQDGEMRWRIFWMTELSSHLPARVQMQCVHALHVLQIGSFALIVQLIVTRKESKASHDHHLTLEVARKSYIVPTLLAHSTLRKAKHILNHFHLQTARRHCHSVSSIVVYF
jgi:hypothetical protein